MGVGGVIQWIGVRWWRERTEGVVVCIGWEGRREFIDGRADPRDWVGIAMEVFLSRLFGNEHVRCQRAASCSRSYIRTRNLDTFNSLCQELKGSILSNPCDRDDALYHSRYTFLGDVQVAGVT